MFNIIILGITSFLTDVSSEMIYPILPLYLVVKLGVSPVILGFIEGISESTASLLKVFSGYFSDKIKKRKPLAILGYASSCVAKIFLYLSTSWIGVFYARFFDRFGKGIRTSPRDALIAESSSPQKLGFSFGMHRMLDTLGASLGVISVYFLIKHNTGYKTIFFYALIPAVLAVLVLFFVRERKSSVQIKTTSKISFLKDFKNLDKRLKIYLIISFVFSLGNSSNQFLLLRAKNLGFDFSQVILLYFVYNLTYALSSFPAGKFSDKLGRKLFLVTSYFIYSLVYFGFALGNSHQMILVLFIFYGLYIGFNEAVEKAFISEIAPGHLKATLIGLQATLVGLALFPASFIAGVLWKVFSPQLAFLFGSVMSIIACLGLLIFI